MEDIGYLWTFQESVDELKQKLQYKAFELEIARKEANEEMKKSNEHIKQLLQLLQRACQERDDAKSQLKKLQLLISINKPTVDQLIPVTAPFSPDSPLFTNYPAKTNSGPTESNSLSVETCKNPQIQSKKSQSHVSSPVLDSLCYPQAAASPDSGTVVDQGSLVIDSLAKGRPLPQKGKLLQAVIEAGPLLQTLMVAGSLPRWRNPPGLVAHPIPPVNIRVCDTNAGALGHRNVADPSDLMKGMGNSSGYGQIFGGSLGIYPSPILDFDGGSSGSCLMGGRLIPSSVNFDCQNPKRQRIM